MKQIRYALEDITSHIGRNLVFLAQITVSLLLFSVILGQMFHLTKLNNSIHQTPANKKTYLMFDVGDMDHFMNVTIYQKDFIDRLDQLYTYLSENRNFKSYSFSECLLRLTDDRLDFSLVSEIDPFEEPYYCGLAINDSFIDYFNLELKAGEFFKLKDYLDTTDLVPVVAGSNFENFFRLGDIIQSKKDGIQYNIIGFLKNGSKYYDIKSSSDIIPLDKALILPIQSNKAKIQNDFGLFDTIINKTVIITDNENMLRSIAEKSAELKLYTFDFKSVGEQMAYINEEMNQWTLSLLVFCMIILFFCIIGMICNTLQVLNELTRELGVHILCGATKRSILLRLFFQVSFLILLPNIFILLIYSVSAITMFTIFISIFLTIIVMIAPYMKVTNTSMNELLRRNE